MHLCVFGVKALRTVEDLIESLNKAHQRDYWQYVTEFELPQKKMSGWNLEEKIKQLQNKRARVPRTIA